jgi:hypothetical protein
MSALAMILTAAMVVPGDGPKMESGEIEQGLDLSGEWEGLWIDDEGIRRKAKLSLSECRLEGERLPGQPLGDIERTLVFLGITDEGAGRICLRDSYLGIYCRDGCDHLICFRDNRKGRPTSFRGGDDQNLLILHRVKPRK